MPRIARTFVCSMVVGLTASCASSPAPKAPQFAPAPANSNRAFSPFVRANGFLFLAGQLGTDSTGKLAPGGIKEETRQTMQNIKSLLERNGSSMDRVVRCLVLLADIGDRQAMSEVYMTFFPADKRPVRTAAGVGGLALSGRVEIECIATE